MFNVYKIRKWASLVIAGSLPVVSFATASIFISFWAGITAFIISLLIVVVIGSFMLKNPFQDLLEKKGLLCMNLDSTGIINFFILGLKSPYIVGRHKGEQIKDVFNRNAVLQISPPLPPEKNNSNYSTNDEATLNVSIDKEIYNKSKFAFMQYPVLIWNSQVKSFLTKDFLSQQEKNIFAEHSVLYLNRLVEDLTSSTRDFGRYVVELTKPKTSFLQSKWFWIILIVGLVVIGLLFAPSIIEAVRGGAESTISAASSGGGFQNPINPI
jgi:hypothetical protein